MSKIGKNKSVVWIMQSDRDYQVIFNPGKRDTRSETAMSSHDDRKVV